MSGWEGLNGSGFALYNQTPAHSNALGEMVLAGQNVEDRRTIIFINLFATYRLSNMISLLH